VLRIMQVNGLTLERHTARRPGRTHDGVVVALRPDVRWSSDHFEPACRNGEVVRVLLAIDACDREVIAWSAATGGVSGEMVRDLMIACVERRFGGTRTAHPVEWLSDNGSAYTAKDTSDTAAALGLRPCFTPPRSPESNGVSEAFVRTLRRDYARLAILPDAEAVMAPSAGLVRRLQRDPPPLRSALPLAPRVPPPECLTQPSHLSGQTGCTPASSQPCEQASPEGQDSCSGGRWWLRAYSEAFDPMPPIAALLASTTWALRTVVPAG
jgi:transposase InsO family protein